MFCKECGKDIPDNSTSCPNCGCASPSNSNDTGSIGWLCLGAIIPIVGLILAIIWKKDKPKNAKKATWGFCIGIIFNAIMYVLYTVMLSAGMAMYS